MRKVPETLVKRSLVKIWTKRREHIQRRQPLKIINELIKNGRDISVSAKVSCDQYAIEVLGNKKFAPWLYVYSAVNGKFREGWISDNYYGDFVVPKLKGLYGDASELNALQSILFASNSFPDLLYSINGIFFDRSFSVVQPHDVEKVLFKDRNRIVFKRDSSMQGRGIHFLNNIDGKTDLNPKALGNGVFQRSIDQHLFFQRFHSNSVATIRMTTVTDDSGDASLRACYLRFGTGNDSHVKSASHVRVPVDLITGELGSLGYDTNWLTLDAHPNSRVAFAGEKIPNFDACREKVLMLHSKVPFVRCIGWDVTVDQTEQPVIMEWNGAHNDIKFSEATQGPCFADLGWERLWH